MWADLIVVPTPEFRQHLCLLQRRENLPVEEFVPEFAVEAFDVAVLPRTSRLDEQRLDSQPREPLADDFGDELGPVIRSDVFRDAVPQHQPGQHPQNVPRALLPGHLDRQTLAGELVDHRQELQGPAFAGPLEHEVVRPHVVAIRRSEPDTGPVIEPQPTALGMSGGHLQPLPSPDPLHSLVIHSPAVSRQPPDL